MKLRVNKHRTYEAYTSEDTLVELTAETIGEAINICRHFTNGYFTYVRRKYSTGKRGEWRLVI